MCLLLINQLIEESSAFTMIVVIICWFSVLLCFIGRIPSINCIGPGVMIFILPLKSYYKGGQKRQYLQSGAHYIFRGLQ